MRKSKITFALTTITVLLAALPAYLLRGAFFIREDFTYLDDVRYLTHGWLYFFEHDFCQSLWFRPLMLVFWKVCYIAFGLNAGLNYTVNAIVLLLTALLCASLARRLGASEAGAKLAALLLVAHPIATDTATYLAARADTLGALTAMYALNLQLKSRRHESGHLINSIPAALVTLTACLFKEMFVTLPLLVFFLPEEIQSGKNKPFGISKRIKWSLPHFVAVAIYMGWRAVVIRHVIGGYGYTHSGLTEAALLWPGNAVYTISKAVKMFFGITYDPVQPHWYRFAAIAALLAAAAWMWIGSKRLKERATLFLAAWVIISISPVLDFVQLIKYSPRLLLFPSIIALLFFARLFPSEPRRGHWIAPIIMLAVWLPASCLVLTARRAESETHRKLLTAMQSYYLPRALSEPANQYKIIFGIPPGMFTLDEMFHSTLPKDTDMLSSPVGTFRFLFGDRINRVVVAKKPGMEYSHRRFPDRWDFENNDRFLGFESDTMIVESIRAPDVLSLMQQGNIVDVSVYDPVTGRLSDVSPLFEETLKRRIETSSAAILWSFDHDLRGWTLGPQLQSEGLVSESAKFTVTGNDPYLTRPVANINPLPYRFVRIDMRVTRASLFEPEVMLGAVWWSANETPPFNLIPRVQFAVKADGVRRNYNVEVGKWPCWYLLGKISSLRVDPTDAPCRLEIFSISLIPYEKAQR